MYVNASKKNQNVDAINIVSNPSLSENTYIRSRKKIQRFTRK